METNNGGLFFEAGMDNEKLKAGIEETIRRIQGLSDASVKGGKAMDEVFDKVSADITSSFEKIDFIVNEHKSSIKELEKEYRQIGLANRGMSIELGSGGYLTERQQAIAKEVRMRKALIKEVEDAANKLHEEEIAFGKLRKKVEENANAHKSLRSRMRELKEEMASMIDQGINEQSEAYKSLTAELGRLQDIQDDIAQQGKVLANDESSFQGVIAGLSGLAGGFSAATGAMSLFASENENLQAVMAKIQSVMAITIGMQQVSQALNKDSAFRLVTLAKAKDMVSAASLRLGTAFVRMGLSANAAKVAVAGLYAVSTVGVSLAISGIIYLIDRFREKQEGAKKAAEQASEAYKKQQEYLSGIGQKYAEQIAVVETYRSALNAENVAHKDKLKIINKLKEIIPDYTATLNDEGRVMWENKEAIDAYMSSLEKSLRFKAAMEDLSKEYAEIYRLESTPQRQPETKDLYINGDTIKVTDYDALAKKYGAIGAGGLSPSVIDAMKEQEDAALELTKSYTEKQIEERKNRVKQIQEYISAGNLLESILNGESTKKNVDDPFTAMLEDRKKKYGEYFKWLDAGYEKEAQIHFAGLLKNGKTYREYLQGLIDSGNLTKKQTHQVTNELVSETNTSITEAFKKSVSEQMSNAAGVVEQLKIIQQIRSGLSSSEDALKEKKEEILKDEEVKLKEKRKSEVQEILKNYISLYDKRLLLHEKYLSDVDALEDEKGKVITTEEKLRIDRTIAYRKKKYAEDKSNLLKETADAQVSIIELTRDRKTLDITKKKYLWESDRKKELLEAEKKAAVEILAVYKKIQEEAPTDDVALVIERITLEIEQMNAELEKVPRERLQEILSGFQKITNALSGLEGEIGEIFSAIGGQIDNIKVGFDKTASSTDKVSAGIAGIVNIINMVSAASAKRDRVEKEFYKNKIALAHEYALALNETLRTQAEMSESGFVKDYSGRINDGFKALSKSTEKYNEALAKLNEGRAKTSLKTAIDWGNVGKGAAAGAATALGTAAALGAAIGTVVGPIGTAIGAAAGVIIGGLVGLFKGKKKKNQYGGLTEVFPELVDGAGKLNKELAKTIINTDQVDDNTKQLIQNALDWAEATEKANQQIKEVVVDLAGDLGNGIKNSLVEAFRSGENASKKMFDAAGKSLEQFVENLVFSALFSDAFKTFESDLVESFGESGDRDVVDDYDRLMGVLKGREKLFNESLRAIQGRADAHGFKLWGKESGKDAPSLTGAVKGVTEETASMVAGQMNAIRINQMEATQMLRQQLFHLSNIDRNTGLIDKNTKYIKAIYDKISSGDTLRAKGLQ